MKNKSGYTKKDLQLIRNFIKEIDEGIVLRIAPNQEFYCQLPLGKIYLGKKKIDNTQFYWYDWYKQQKFFSKEDINLRMVASLLHEIGHFATFDINEWLDRNKKVPQLTEKYLKGELTLKELNFAYWNLPNEYKATEWAVNYYKSNKEKCDKLAEMIKFKYIFTSK